MLPRTERQAQILEFIQSYSAKRGAQPSYGLIARHIGVKSRATVAKHIAALEKRGLVDPRTLRLRIRLEDIGGANEVPAL